MYKISMESTEIFNTVLNRYKSFGKGEKKKSVFWSLCKRINSSS